MLDECENPECRSIAVKTLDFGERHDELEYLPPSERICTTASLCAHCAESATRNWKDDRVGGFVRERDE